MICECITKESSWSAQTEQVAVLPIHFPLALSFPALQSRVGSMKLLPLPCHAPTFLQKRVGGNLIIFKWVLAQIVCEAKRGFHWNTKCVEKGLEDGLRFKKWVLKQQHTAIEAYLSYREVIFDVEFTSSLEVVSWEMWEVTKKKKNVGHFQKAYICFFMDSCLNI